MRSLFTFWLFLALCASVHADEGEITVYTIESLDISFLIYQPDYDPVLLDYFDSNLYKDMDDVEQFNYEPESKTFSIVLTATEEVDQPVRIELNNRKVKVFYNSPSSDEATELKSITSEVTVKKRTGEDFIRSESPYHTILEPGVTTPVSVETYFLNRNIPFGTLVFSPDHLDLSDDFDNKRELIWKTLGQEERPTIKQLVESIGIPSGRVILIKDPDQVGSIENEIPRAVASMERAYPGAVWYGLGRDAFFPTDAFDSFFTYIGQPGKVRRLPASAPSFDKKNDKEVVGFLEKHGIILKDFLKADSKPVLIFDITSYNKRGPSQSRQIMRAAYQHWTEVLEQDPKVLLEKLNFVSISGSMASETDRFQNITKSFDLAKYLKRVEFDAGPVPILSLEKRLNKTTYTPGWHGMFGRFRPTEDGLYDTTLGDEAPTSTRLVILAELFGIIQKTMNDRFVGLVIDSAKSLGDQTFSNHLEAFLAKDRADGNDCHGTFGSGT